MTKKLSIKMSNGEKETEFTIDDPSKFTEQAIITGLLGFMNIEITENFIHMQKMYTDFYDKAEHVEFAETNEEIAADVEVEEVLDEDLSDSELFSMGLKRNKIGDIVYRCRYACTNCEKLGNHYIYPEHDFVNCHDCEEKLEVRETTATANNGHAHYYAGNFYA